MVDGSIPATMRADQSVQKPGLGASINQSNNGGNDGAVLENNTGPE